MNKLKTTLDIWKTTLDISSEKNAFENNEITIKQLAHAFVKKLKKNKCSQDLILVDIISKFESFDNENDVDDFRKDCISLLIMIVVFGLYLKRNIEEEEVIGIAADESRVNFYFGKKDE